MERIKELNGMVMNGATKGRSAGAERSQLQPLLPNHREED